MSRTISATKLLGAAAVLALAALAWIGFHDWGWLVISSPSEGVAITVRFDNRTTQRVGPFTITRRRDGASVTVPRIEPGATERIRFVDAIGGEGSIVFTDAARRQYPMVGYFESPLGGTVDVRIASVSATGAIEGTIRRWVSYFGSPEWEPLAWSDCRAGGVDCVVAH